MSPDRIAEIEAEQIRMVLDSLRGRLPMGLSEEELMQGYQQGGA